MSALALPADPGVGRDGAPVGSVEWAQRIRLRLQSIVHDLPKLPESAGRYFSKVQETRAWTLMNKPDGATFKSFDEFCEYKEPWGLGKPWTEIQPFLEAALGRRATQLVTVSPAQLPVGRAGAKEGPEVPSFSSRNDKRIRAIAERAPEPARDLFKAGHLGAKEAAKLGPKNPTPEEAARVTEIARKAVDVARVFKDKPAREVQKAVNQVVRTALGVKPAPASLDYTRICTAVMGLSVEHLRGLRNIVDGLLKSKGAT